MYQLTWTDRRGGHVVQSGDAAELVSRMKNLKANATLRKNGEEVGAVWKNEGQWTWYFDPEEAA